MRSTTRPCRTWKTCTDAPAGPSFEPERVAVAELGARHLLLPRAERLDRADRVAQLRRLLEALGVGRLLHAIAQRRRRSSSFRPSRNSCVCSTATRYSSGEQIVAHARRDASLDVVLEARPAALAGDDLVARPDAEQPVRQRHRPAAERGRQKRPGVEVAVALHAPRDQHARKRLAGRQLQVGIVLVVAQQDVVARRRAA